MPTYATNRKARFDYEILETFEAGLELLGGEARSIRNGRGTLEGARVIIRGDEAFLVGASIAPYQPENDTGEKYEPERTRRLLLKKKEMDRLAGAEKEKGLTIIPLSLYSSKRWVKVKIAVVKGKKKHDKRETLKKRDAERDVAREARWQM